MTGQTANRLLLIIAASVLMTAVACLAIMGLDSVARASTNPVRKPAAKTVPQPLPALTPVYPKNVILNVNNTLSIRGPVTTPAVMKLSNQLLVMSRSLPTNAVIYLVLDTPGGEVYAGSRFVDLANSIPQRVDTITVEAASMGFHFVQALGYRLIIPSGRLMSHRVHITGVSGQVPGEAVSRLNEVNNARIALDLLAATRMKMSFDDYQILIRDEYRVQGFKAVREHAADAVIHATCDHTFDGFSEAYNSYGAKVMMSNCPLISGEIEL